MTRLRMLLVVAIVGALTFSMAPPAHSYYLFLRMIGFSHADAEFEERLLWGADLEAGLTPFAAADPLKECVQRRTVMLQRRRPNGAWRTVDRDKTNLKGKARGAAPDRPGRYRVKARAFTSASGYDCFAGTSAVKRHRH